MNANEMLLRKGRGKVKEKMKRPKRVDIYAGKDEEENERK